MSSEFDYKQYLSLVKKRKLPVVIVALLVMTIAVIACYLLPNKYEAQSTVFIEKNIIGELVKGIAVTPSKDDAIKVLKYAITSRTTILKVLADLDVASTRAKSEAAREELIRTTQENIDVKVKDNNLFIISFTDTNPRVARDFVNTLVQRYIEEILSAKREESYGATKFLTEQIGTVKQKLTQAETDLNNFKAEKGGVINVDEAKLFEEINLAQQKLYDLQLRRRQLEGLKPVARMAADPLQARLAFLQKHLEELRVEYTDSYPGVIKVKSDIETVREQIQGRHGALQALPDSEEIGKVQAELSAVKMSEASLQRYIGMNQALLKGIPTAKAGLEKLEMEKQSRKELYDKLLSRQGQSEMSQQMEVQDKTTTFRIIDPAVIPSFPASPNRVKIILLGILAGLAAGIGIALLLDNLDHSVKSIDALKKFGAPVLATISTIQDPQEVSRRRRIDTKIYLFAGAYFSLILVVLVVEVISRYV
ncbi:MAG: GNVR domain-containing protein [Geobacteraceae bacterium]|nr:GNVR domain-containing protein [Geobacteraceae bacterium]